MHLALFRTTLLIIISFFIVQGNLIFLFALDKTLYNSQENQPCEYVKSIEFEITGVRKFTAMEQRGLGFTSNQYLCYMKIKGECRPKPNPTTSKGIPPDPEPPTSTTPFPPDPEPPIVIGEPTVLPQGPPEETVDPEPPKSVLEGLPSETEQQNERAVQRGRTVKLAICDAISCSNSDRECQCPTDPMECLKDNIDGRSSYTNGQKMVKMDTEASGCQSTSPMKARELIIEERRQYGFKAEYICYSENVKNCRINGVQIEENVSAICDVGTLHGINHPHPCLPGYVGVSCACPVDINECVKDKVDGHNMYSNTRRIEVEEDRRSYTRPQRDEGGGIE